LEQVMLVYSCRLQSNLCAYHKPVIKDAVHWQASVKANRTPTLLNYKYAGQRLV